MKRSPSSCRTTPKEDKLSQKNRSLLVHNVELCIITVAKVDIKVINAQFKSKSMTTMFNAALTHVEIPRLHESTELNNDDMIKLCDVQCQTEPNLSIFSGRDLINEDSSFFRKFF